MIVRCLLLAATLAAAVAPVAVLADTDADRLKSILKKKYSKDTQPGTRSVPAPAQPDLYIIGPDGKVRSVPSQNKSSNDGPSGPVRNLSFAGVVAGPALAAAGDAANSAGRGGEPSPASPAGEIAVAQGEQQQQMVVNRRIVVIQLKANTSEAEIEQLIAKFDLSVIDAVPSLGALYVELAEEDLPDAQTIAPEQRSSVRTLLEPSIVVRLRAEPSVNAAFVQTTVAPQNIPPPSDAEIRMEQGPVKWNWLIGANNDGNWGLKSIHLPQVWTILSGERKARGAEAPASVAVLDSGFGKHAQLVYQNVKGTLPEELIPADCARSHGTHVAGIISARRTGDGGIDGIVPKARLDAIPISRNLLLEGTLDGAERPQLHLSYFADVIRDLGEYFDEFPLAPAERRVVNVSLAYNWGWVRRISASDPTTDQSVRNQVQQHANFIQYLVDRVNTQVLFVAAAGNDSEGAAEPMGAKLASPFAFAALHSTAYFKPSSNIIVVEAHDRNNRRAGFSNTGGHVSAPGVDVMSTLASQSKPYGTCSGTSQAAPHVTALAAILFELDKTKTPEEVIGIIRRSAVPDAASGSAPAIDALSAVAELSGRHLNRLADLDGDGQVDAADLDLFKGDLIALEGGRYGGSISDDLNGDGIVDNTERCWPRIDLNGSGRASYDANDKRLVGGVMRSDLDVLRSAWSDDTETFETALQRNGVSELIATWQGTILIAASPLLHEPFPCQ